MSTIAIAQAVETGDGNTDSQTVPMIRRTNAIAPSTHVLHIMNIGFVHAFVRTIQYSVSCISACTVGVSLNSRRSIYTRLTRGSIYALPAVSHCLAVRLYVVQIAYRYRSILGDQRWI